jgi:hypothetical protein
LKREKTTYRGLEAGRHWTLQRDGARAQDTPLRRFDVPLPR